MQRKQWSNYPHQRSKLIPTLAQSRTGINIEEPRTRYIKVNLFLLADDGDADRKLIVDTSSSRKHNIW